jgi:hypothetical protein
MSAPQVTHINLLQRSEPAHAVALSLAGLLAATLIGTFYYGHHVRSLARDAVDRRDALTLQLNQVKSRLGARTGESARNADALALRKEIDALQAQSQAAQAVVDAVRTAQAGRTDQFARALSAMTTVGESGLWLTSLTVSSGGSRMEVQGQARSGAAVLRFARRANDSLQPLSLRLDSLEMQPSAAATGNAGAVSFNLH